MWSAIFGFDFSLGPVRINYVANSFGLFRHYLISEVCSVASKKEKFFFFDSKTKLFLKQINFKNVVPEKIYNFVWSIFHRWNPF